jgi:hypothetical protein
MRLVLGIDVADMGFGPWDAVLHGVQLACVIGARFCVSSAETAIERKSRRNHPYRHAPRLLGSCEDRLSGADLRLVLGRNRVRRWDSRNLHPLLAAIRRIRKIGLGAVAEIPNGNGRKLDIARRPCLDQFPGLLARRDIRRVALRLVTISPALRQRGRPGSGRRRCNWDRTPIVRAGLYVRIETFRILAKEPCRRERPINSRFGGA